MTKENSQLEQVVLLKFLAIIMFKKKQRKLAITVSRNTHYRKSSECNFYQRCMLLSKIILPFQENIVNETSI